MPDRSKTLIYLVDDDDSVRKALQMLLLSADMEVECFSCAEEFLASAPREEGTCLVTDVMMKGLSGLALQKRLIASGTKIPVIFVTAFDTPESREEAKRFGAAGYFRKPVDDTALLDAIRWALSNR